MNSDAIKILLVDDHQMLRKGVRLMLAGRDGLTVVGEANSRQSALEQTRLLSPQVVIMDIHLPGENGIEISRLILREFPEVKIIALSGDADLAVIHQALEAGISGYLTKTGDPEELMHAIRAVLEQRVYLCPEVASLVVGDYMKMKTEIGTPAPAKPKLSERDRQLLRLIAEGKRSKEIAAEMGVGVKSVETYRSRLMKKLECASAVELARYAIREGITTL